LISDSVSGHGLLADSALGTPDTRHTGDACRRGGYQPWYQLPQGEGRVERSFPRRPHPHPGHAGGIVEVAPEVDAVPVADPESDLRSGAREACA